jgi:hypothetical protein
MNDGLTGGSWQIAIDDLEIWDNTTTIPPVNYSHTNAPDSSNLSYTVKSVDTTNNVSGASDSALVETFYKPNAPTNLTDQGASVPLIIDWTASTVNDVTNSNSWTWDITNSFSMSLNGNTITKTSGAGWNSYIRTNETINPSSGGGEFAWKLPTATSNQYEMGGFSQGGYTVNSTYSDLTYGILFTNSGQVQIWHNGGHIGNFTITGFNTATSVFKVVMDNSGTVTYWHNNDLLHTSNYTASGNYYGHSALYGQNNTLELITPSSVTNPSPSVTGYKIERDDGSGFNVIVADTQSTNVQYSDSSASGNVTYRISGINAVGIGAVSATHNALAGVPADAPSVSLAWNDPATLDVEVSITNGSSMGTGTFSNYSVERSNDGGVSWSVVGSPATSPFIDTTIIGQSDYRVTSVTNHGISNYSTTATINTIPWNTITGINTSIVDPNAFPLQISIGYDVATQGNGTGNLTGYELYRDGSLLATLGLVTAYTDNVTTSGTYLYDLKSLSVHGNSALSGNGSSIATPTVPTAINDLSANILSDTEIDLNFSIPNNGGSNIIDYDVLRDGVTIATVTTNSYSDTGLTANTQYTYEVFSRNLIGFSLISNQITPTTHTPVGGSISITPSTQGAMTEFVFAPANITGSPTPSFTSYSLQEDGVTVVNNITSSPYYYSHGDNLSHTYTLTSTDNTHWNTPTITGSITTQGTYAPSWSNNISYEYDRANNLLTVNRNDNNSWDLTCNYRTGTEVINGTPGTSFAHTGVWYVVENHVLSPTDTVYIECKEGTTLILSETSFGPNRLGGGIAQLNDMFDGFLGDGVPVALLFVLLVAGLFTGRTAPTGILLILALIGVLGFIGLMTIDDAIWGFILLAGVLGIFLGKRFL